MKSVTTALVLAIASNFACISANAADPAVITTMPDEASPHEGTWLQWPHRYTYGSTYASRLDATWVAISKALVSNEKIHIIAYNASEQTRITNLLITAKIPLANVTFLLRQTDDVWVRDNGPVFAYDSSNKLKILDWGFNGWGFDTVFSKDNSVPAGVAAALKLPAINLNDVTLENGAIALDGKGVAMATRSSVMDLTRNPDLTEDEMNEVLRTYLGVKKIIWLDGKDGGNEDITDMHIDGFVSFAPNGKIVTMSDADLDYWGLSAADIKTLHAATDTAGLPYQRILLPLTAKNVVTTYGKNLGYKGSYANYYVANKVVLMPSYNDPNDAVAKGILEKIYPGRTVIAIDVRNLYANGGMIHCVTQQQPVVLP